MKSFVSILGLANVWSLFLQVMIESFDERPKEKKVKFESSHFY